MEIYDIDTKVSFVCKHPPEEKPEGSTTPQGVCMSVTHTPVGLWNPSKGAGPYLLYTVLGTYRQNL